MAEDNQNLETQLQEGNTGQQLPFHNHDGINSPVVNRTAILPVSLTSEVTGLLPLANGGTGATTASGARTNLGINIKFGGDGSDGALAIGSGTTTLSFGSAKVLTKNYTSISITAGTLTTSNPHTNGSLLILKSQGDVTITGAAVVDLREMGAAAATQAWGILDDLTDHAGQTGAGGTRYTNRNLYTYESQFLNRRMIIAVPGSGGVDGVGGSTDAGPGGAGSLYGIGGANRSGSGNGNAAGGAMAGGGGACSGSGTGSTVAKGGGGALIIECAGALNFTGTIYTKGSSPASGSGVRQSGSGSGGGMCIILYNTLTSNAGTIDDAGGAGGDISGGFTGGAGGAAIGGLVAKNEWFT